MLVGHVTNFLFRSWVYLYWLAVTIWCHRPILHRQFKTIVYVKATSDMTSTQFVLTFIWNQSHLTVMQAWIFNSCRIGTGCPVSKYSYASSYNCTILSQDLYVPTCEQRIPAIRTRPFIDQRDSFFGNFKNSSSFGMGRELGLKSQLAEPGISAHQWSKHFDINGPIC